jgi:hypothetical protein
LDTLQRKVELLGRELRDRETPMDEIEFYAHVDEDVLTLISPRATRCCRSIPALKLSPTLSTEAIARAFAVQTRPGRDGSPARRRCSPTRTCRSTRRLRVPDGYS